jgi:hypothetical protein
MRAMRDIVLSGVAVLKAAFYRLVLRTDRSQRWSIGWHVIPGAY